MFKRKSWEDENPVEVLLTTLGDYIEHTQPNFKNKVYVRIYLKKLLDYFFVVYFEWFVWIAKNAFHKDKFLENYRPPSVDPLLEKEIGRKDIKNFLKNAVVVKSLLKRDLALLSDFVEKKKDFFAESFLENFKINSELLMKRLFEGENAEKNGKAAVKNLDEAIQKVAENFKK